MTNVSIEKREELISRLICDFGRFLELYDRHVSVSRYGQLAFHVNTIAKRRELGSARAAISDTPFLKSLHETLEAWGIGSCASRLCSYEKFAAALNGVTIRAVLEKRFPPFLILRGA